MLKCIMYIQGVPKKTTHFVSVITFYSEDRFETFKKHVKEKIQENIFGNFYLMTGNVVEEQPVDNLKRRISVLFYSVVIFIFIVLLSSVQILFNNLELLFE